MTHSRIGRAGSTQPPAQPLPKRTASGRVPDHEAAGRPGWDRLCPSRPTGKAGYWPVDATGGDETSDALAGLAARPAGSWRRPPPGREPCGQGRHCTSANQINGVRSIRAPIALPGQPRLSQPFCYSCLLRTQPLNVVLDRVAGDLPALTDLE